MVPTTAMDKHRCIGWMLCTCSYHHTRPDSIGTYVPTRLGSWLAIYPDQIAIGTYSVSWIGEHLLSADSDCSGVDMPLILTNLMPHLRLYRPIIYMFILLILAFWGSYQIELNLFCLTYFQKIIKIEMGVRVDVADERICSKWKVALSRCMALS